MILSLTKPEQIPAVMALEAAPSAAQFVDQWSEAEHLEAIQSDSCAHWTAVDADGSVVGYLILQDLKNHSRAAWFRRIVAGKRGIGLGRAMVEQALRHVFKELGFHRMWLNVDERNAAAHQLYRSFGFVDEGVAREAILNSDGSWSSYVVMGLLEREFISTDDGNYFSRIKV